MKMEVFRQVYPDQVPEERLQQKPQYEMMRELTERSQALGTALHAYMAGDQPDLTRVSLADHARFVKATVPGVEDRIEHDVRPEWRPRFAAALAVFEHEAALMPMWLPVVNGGWESAEQCLNSARQSHSNLARLAAKLYLGRHEMVSSWPRADAAYLFGSELRKRSLGHYGRALNDIDGGLALLDGIAHPMQETDQVKYTALAAPYQFKHGAVNDAHRTRVDFILADVEQREAVGYQVKARVHRELSEEEQPDKDRVVVLDGRKGLYGVRCVAMSIARKESTEISWAGRLGIYTYHNVPPRSGKDPLDYPGQASESERDVREKVSEIMAAMDMHVHARSRSRRLVMKRGRAALRGMRDSEA